MAAEATYSFGVVPQFESNQRAETWLPVLAEISKRTGLTLKLKGSTRIPDFDRAIMRGELDFAYLNPLTALQATHQQGYRLLVRGEDSLQGIVVVRQGSSFKTVADLAGQKIAFPAPNAIGASLLVRADLENLYKIRYTPIFAQTHASAYLNAALGTAAAAGGVLATFNQTPPETRDKLRIIHHTRKIPSHPVIAHPRVPEAHRLLIQKAFLELAATKEGAILLERIPMSRPVPATLADYDVIPTLGLETLQRKHGDR